jgi:hypothetical protein
MHKKNSGNIFHDLGLKNANELLMKADLKIKQYEHLNKINLYEFFGHQDVLNSSVDEDDLIELSHLIIQKINKIDIVYVDLKNIRSLSPTFAYEAFGKLVDKIPNVINRLRFLNDSRKLRDRILTAIQRRQKIKRVY